MWTREYGYVKLDNVKSGSGIIENITSLLTNKTVQDIGQKAIKTFGEDVVTQLSHTLLEGGAPGIHFYTMNKTEPTQALWKNLGLSA